jgi:transcriptional regulator with XRE-family HTH domain
MEKEEGKKKKKNKNRNGKTVSYHKLSKLSGVSLSYISRLFNGRRQNPSLKTIRKIAKGLGISEGAVMKRVEDARKEKLGKKYAKN